MAKTWIGAAKAQENDGSEKERPILRRYWTSDTTREALAEILVENSRGIAIVRDELSRWVGAMNEYHRNGGADREFFLSLWSGEPIIVDRKSHGDRGPLIVNDPHVAVIGGITPDMLGRLCDERGRDDGFIHRILFAYPDAASTGAWTEATITDEAEQAWCAAYNALAALAPESDGRPKIVPFTERARKVWAEWFTVHNAEIAQPDFPESLRGAWGKCRSYFPRFALTLQMLHCACGEADSEDVDERSARGAVALVDYFKSHAVRAYKRLRVTPGDKRATAAEHWIRNHGGRSTARDLVKNEVAGIKKATDAEAVLKDLEDRGRGRLTAGRRGGVGIVLGTEGKQRKPDSRKTT